MDETLSCVQSDIMAVHRHQMAMPKDESTSERAARCVVDARQHKGSTRYNGQRERIYLVYAGSSISPQVYLCTSTMLERRWTPERTSRRGNILWHLSPHSRPASRTQPKCMSRRVGVLRRKGYIIIIILEASQASFPACTFLCRTGPRSPAPSQQSLLSARRGEVHVYLQRATGPGCPLLETFANLNLNSNLTRGPLPR